MNKIIYLAWQDQSDRRWHIIGQLLRNVNGYEFRYTNGVKNSKTFSALPSMNEYNKVYRSTDLFSLFQNRVMPKSRPDYINHMKWMGINHESVDEMDALSISGGERETDSFRIIPVPTQDSNGVYSFNFFANGLSHMTTDAQQRVNTLQPGDSLYLAHDFQNQQDKFSLFLRTEDPPCLVGYLPAYLAKVIHKINDENKDNLLYVNVSQINQDAPVQKRLLCNLSSAQLNQSWDAYEDEFKTII